MKPFFRADQVGSLLRPQHLMEARAQFERGAISQESLRAIEDTAIAKIARQQEALGFQVVVDGEFRRENWWIDFARSLRGVDIHDGHSKGFERTATDCGHDHGADASEDHSWQYVPKNVFVKEPIALEGSLNARDFANLKAAVGVSAKITIPSPTRLHFHGGRAAVSSAAYPDIETFFADVVRVYQQEIADLEAAGCRYIQIDDPLLTYFISDRLRAEVTAAGENPDERLARYIQLTNDCIANRRSDTAIGIHVCRGNSRSGWISEGGYARIAEAVFGGLQCDHLLLEYDDERSGDFEPLRYIPKGQRVVLGLVTTKYGQLEQQDDLLRRIDAASRYVPIENLALSPQCGFASTVEGNIITEDDQWKKLALIVDTAKRVWG
jgi:5-methyltetrahydropteroyltriglutamate--homocysteine methyltransferase